MSDGRESSAVDVSKITQMTSRPESAPCSGKNLGDIRLLPRWCPAYRQHEPSPGSRVEHVKARPETAGQHSNRLSAELREEFSLSAIRTPPVRLLACRFMP